MGKVSEDDKMRIQTLREQGLGYRVIASKYPTKNWKLDTVKAICRRFDERGSALLRKPGSGRPKTARTVENIERVQEQTIASLCESKRRAFRTSSVIVLSDFPMIRLQTVSVSL
jgi:transposase